MHCLPLEKCGLGQKFPSTITVSRSFSSYSGLFGCLWREYWGRGPDGIPDCYLTRYVTLGLEDFLQKQRESSWLQKLWSGGCVVRAVTNRWGWGPQVRGKHQGGVTCFWSFPSSGSWVWGRLAPSLDCWRDLPGKSSPWTWGGCGSQYPTSAQLVNRSELFFLEALARPVWGAAWEATPAYKVTGQTLWRARHSNKKPEPGGQRGVLGLEKHSQALFCLTGEKRKSKGPSSARGAGTALAHTGQAAAVDALWGLNCKRQQAFSWLAGRESSLQWQTEIMDLGQVWAFRGYREN